MFISGYAKLNDQSVGYSSYSVFSPFLIFLFFRTSVRLQFRLPDGSSVTNSFAADATIDSVKEFISNVSFFQFVSTQGATI